MSASQYAVLENQKAASIDLQPDRYMPHPSSPWRHDDHLARFRSLKHRYFVAIIASVSQADAVQRQADACVAWIAARQDKRCRIIVGSDTMHLSHCCEREQTVSVALEPRLCDRQTAGETPEKTLRRDHRNPWRQHAGVESVGQVLNRSTAAIADLEKDLQPCDVLLLVPPSVAEVLLSSLSGRPLCSGPALSLDAGVIHPIEDRPDRASLSQMYESERFAMRPIPWHPLNWFRHGQGWLRRIYHLLGSPQTHWRLLAQHRSALANRQSVPAEYVQSRPSQPPQIHAVYFTCGKHFRYLLPSVSSLSRFREQLGTVYVYCDQQDRIDREQQQQLARSGVKIELVFGDRSTGWGGRSMLNQLGFMQRIACHHAPQDYLAKIDADVLFVNGRILEFVANSDADVVGNPCVNTHVKDRPYTYPQGGCYFVRSELMTRTRQQSVLRSVWHGGSRAAIPFPHCPEDAGTYDFLERMTENIAMREFFLPTYAIQQPAEDWPDWASCIHFERLWFGELREEMAEYAARIAACSRSTVSPASVSAVSGSNAAEWLTAAKFGHFH